VALFIALFGERMKGWFYRPDLGLKAAVKLPNSQRVERFRLVPGSYVSIGESWFFRLEVTNTGRAPARNVQVFLEKVVKGDGANVDRFSPMNLKWAHTGEVTRPLLLRKIRVYCDFIHIGDPAFRSASGDDLDTVPSGKGVLSLDVEATSTAKAHLLEPGVYLFYLLLAAESFEARPYTVVVHYTGNWFLDQSQMCNEATGFWMGEVQP
jgi:hypothetical protein